MNKTNHLKPQMAMILAAIWFGIIAFFAAAFAVTGCAVPQIVSTPSLQIESTIVPGEIHLINPMQSERAAHTSTLLGSGKILIVGGFGPGDNAYTDSAERYDPTRGNFEAAGNLSDKRCCHTATRLPDGRVLIAGGFNGAYLATAEIYDATTGKYIPTGALATARMDHVATLLDNGKVLLAGGVGEGWTFLASAELYDPITGSFTPTGGMSVPRESHTVTKLNDGRVLITGGHQGRRAKITIYDSAEIYDPAAGIFQATGQLTVSRHKHDAVLLADGRVLVTGGSDERDDRGAYMSAEMYDPTTGMFRLAAEMPKIRYKHKGTSLLLKNGKVLLVGGSRNAALYNPDYNTFSIIPGNLGTAALSRLFSTATLLNDGTVLITGGYEIGHDVTANAWIYTP